MLKVALASVGYPNFRWDLAQNTLDKTAELLREREDIQLALAERVLITEEGAARGFRELGAARPDLVILQLGTYSHGSALLACLEELRGAHLLLWAFREPVLPDYEGLPLNSLCALNMYTSFLHRLGVKDFSWLYGDLSEEGTLGELEAILAAAALKADLRRSRFCVIGGRVPGFYLSEVDELNFRRQVGPEIVRYSLAELLESARGQDPVQVTAELAAVRASLPQITADPGSLERSCRVALALRDLAAREEIDGFALKCWPDFQDLYHLAVCGAVSRLNSQGLLTACEGDVTGLATMFLMQRLTPKPVFLTDLVNLSREGTVKLWHCGCASPDLAAKGCAPCCGEHPTMKGGLGVGLNMDLMEGPVVVAKLSEGTPYRLLLARGECVPPDRALTGNQGDVRLAGDPRRLLELIVDEGLEHHYCMAYGADPEVLRRFCRLCGFTCLEV